MCDCSRLHYPILLGIQAAKHEVMLCLFNPNKHGPFWHLNSPGCCAYYAAVHTCCASQVAHLYDAGVFRSPNKGFPANFLETSEKLATSRAILGHL